MLIGGREPMLALDMLEAAKQAMVPPHFEISLMADPSGAFTTAAGMIAVAEKQLKAKGATSRGARWRCSAPPGPWARSPG